jgi:uncharacterized membrane protein
MKNNNQVRGYVTAAVMAAVLAVMAPMRRMPAI